MMSRPDTASRAYFARKPTSFSQEALSYLHMSHCSEKNRAFSARKNANRAALQQSPIRHPGEGRGPLFVAQKPIVGLLRVDKWIPAFAGMTSQFGSRLCLS